MKPKILAFAGSTRKDSYNKKLVKVAAHFARESGAEVNIIDLKDYEMPLYDGDLEAEKGIPDNAMKFMELMIAHDGILISSPEYNSSVSAVLKNSLDWASRPVSGKKTLEAFDGKVACLLSASEGALGGLRGLVTLRSILGNIKVIVLPDQFALSGADKAFDNQGNLQNPATQKIVQTVVDKFVKTVSKIKA